MQWGRQFGIVKTLNAKTAKYMIFENSRKIKELDDISIKLDASTSEQVAIFKYLGVHFNQQLTGRNTCRK